MKKNGIIILVKGAEMKEKDEKQNKIKEVERPKCPNCGSENIMINGRCITCYECGSSTCSM